MKKECRSVVVWISLAISGCAAIYTFLFGLFCNLAKRLKTQLGFNFSDRRGERGRGGGKKGREGGEGEEGGEGGEGEGKGGKGDWRGKQKERIKWGCWFGLRKDKTSAPIGAWKGNFPPIKKIMIDQPTNRPTNRRIGGVIGKSSSPKSVWFGVS